MYCSRCERSFRLDKHYQQHVQTSSHHNICNTCNLDYASHSGLIKHYKKDHYYCSSHNQLFQAWSNLQAHLHSTAHMGRNVDCPCESSFPTVSALFLHIEEGGCSSVSPHGLMHYLELHQVDIQDLAMNEGWGGLSEDKINGWLDSWIDDAWDYYESAYLCRYCQRTFPKASSFGAHIRNARKNKGSIWYNCEDCNKRFDYPSGLAQHFESRCCQ